jgi:predicted DNA-binding transcriptional regulator AlpA
MLTVETSGPTDIANARIRPGDNLRKPSSVGARFDRSLAWVWERVKNDPEFPKPVYRHGMCFFIERELDAYIATNFVEQSSDRAGRARVGKVAA